LYGIILRSLTFQRTICLTWQILLNRVKGIAQEINFDCKTGEKVLKNNLPLEKPGAVKMISGFPEVITLI
jgi:hypothetical protein